MVVGKPGCTVLVRLSFLPDRAVIAWLFLLRSMLSLNQAQDRIGVVFIENYRQR